VSFDIFFQPCRFGADNPATDQNRLTADETAAVLQILNTSSTAGGDEGSWTLVTDDGGEAEVFAADLQRGCMVALRGMTAGVRQLLFDILGAGNWVMLPIVEENIAIKTTETLLTDLPSDFPQVVDCGSAGELNVLLEGGYQAWAKYRNQILGNNG
jgi:hypothetical protein